MHSQAKTATGSPETVAATGLWRIEQGRAVAVDPAFPGPLTVLVPSEQVLLTVVDLPFPSRRRRAEAAPFAVEGLIAEPLDQVHVALGQEVSDRRHLCAVVGHGLMRSWVQVLEAAGLEHCVLMPDALALPRPPEGFWRVAIVSERALVRTASTGFAVPAGALAAAWEAAGRPRLIEGDGTLPDAMRDGLAETTLELEGAAHPVVMVPPVDLRQGIYAAARPARGSPWRTLALITGLGAVAHLAVLAVDTLALHGMAERREAETRRLVAERQPALADGDLVSAVDRLAPQGRTEGLVLRRLSAVARALPGQALAYRAIDFAGTGEVRLAVTARDATALDAGVAALSGAALPARITLDPVVTGTATAQGVNAVIVLDSRGDQP